MRVEFDLADFTLELRDFAHEFQPIADRFRMHWRVEDTARLPASPFCCFAYVSTAWSTCSHRHRLASCESQIALIVSNHEDAKAVGEFYHVPFHYVPVEAGRKAEAEAAQIDLIERNAIDLIVLGALHASPLLSICRAVSTPHYHGAPLLPAGF